MKEIQFSKAKWQQDREGTWLMLLADKAQVNIVRQLEFMVKKVWTAVLKEYRPKRSLDANAYFWVLCEKIAQKTMVDKWSVYLELLQGYGVFTHIVVKPKAAERIKTEWRTVVDLGEVTVGENTGIQLQCYYGSSTYNTKEMARLIDGAVNEAKELEIDTLPPHELDRMKEEWDAKKPATG